MSFRGDLRGHKIDCTLTEVILGAVLCKYQAAPAEMTTLATITVADILGGVIEGTHAVGATQAYTLPTGTVMDAALDADFVINSSFEFTIVNLSAAGTDTITLTAAATFTIVGVAVIANLASGTFRVRKTAANTFVAYRL